MPNVANEPRAAMTGSHRAAWRVGSICMFGGELLSQKTLENSFRNPANRKRPFVRRTVNWNALVGGVRCG